MSISNADLDIDSDEDISGLNKENNQYVDMKRVQELKRRGIRPTYVPHVPKQRNAPAADDDDDDDDEFLKEAEIISQSRGNNVPVANEDFANPFEYEEGLDVNLDPSVLEKAHEAMSKAKPTPREDSPESNRSLPFDSFDSDNSFLDEENIQEEENQIAQSEVSDHAKKRHKQQQNNFVSQHKPEWRQLETQAEEITGQDHVSFDQVVQVSEERFDIPSDVEGGKGKKKRQTKKKQQKKKYYMKTKKHGKKYFSASEVERKIKETYEKMKERQQEKMQMFMDRERAKMQQEAMRRNQPPSYPSSSGPPSPLNLIEQRDQDVAKANKYLFQAAEKQDEVNKINEERLKQVVIEARALLNKQQEELMQINQESFGDASLRQDDTSFGQVPDSFQQGDTSLRQVPDSFQQGDTSLRQDAGRRSRRRRRLYKPRRYSKRRK
jgi:hypothetical protein